MREKKSFLCHVLRKGEGCEREKRKKNKTKQSDKLGAAREGEERERIEEGEANFLPSFYPFSHVSWFSNIRNGNFCRSAMAAGGRCSFC